MRRMLTTFVLVFITWLMLTYNLHTGSIILGIVISLAITVICRHLLSKDTPRIILHPKRWVAFIVYICFMVYVEIVSHIDVMKRIITGKVRPAIVEIPVEFKTTLGKTLLGNSITLTPGTLTVNATEDDRFFIHTIGYKKNHNIGGTINRFGRRVIG